MIVKKTINKYLNKIMKDDTVDHPRIHAILIKLAVNEPDKWLPVYMAYVTKKEPGKAGEKEPEVLSAYDREGK